MIATSASFDAQANSLKKLNTQHAFWALIAFIAAQRFALPSVSGLICLIPFVAALLHFGRNEKLRNTLLFIALFWSIDNAVSGYGHTPAAVRYLIYVTIILTLALNSAIKKTGLLGTTLVCALYLGTTLAHANDTLSSAQMWRDFNILLLGGILFSLRNRRAFELDIGLLFYSGIGFLLSECVNYLAFGESWYGDYMSYDTTKYLIAIPSLIALFVGRPLVAWVLVGLTILVLIGYTHRTLFLGYLISLVAILALLPMKNGLIQRVFAIAGIGVAIFLASRLDILTAFESTKALNMFNLLYLHGFQVLEILDPVRIQSSAIFFKLPLFEILFGRGLGSGIYDANQVFRFVSLDQSAFSARELQSGYFFNFHDVWVDVGLRFGLLPLTIFFFWVLRLKPVGNHSGTGIWLLILVGIFSAFYGTSGLISIAVLLRVAQSYRASHV